MMPTKRRWRTYPKRIMEELNWFSGAAGVGGATAGLAGWSSLGATAAFSLMAIGAVISVGTLGIALFRAIPARMTTITEVVGTAISLTDLSNVSPVPSTLSIIGPSQAGKTTLKQRLNLIPGPTSRTQAITAYITSLQTTPPAYVAILDGGGEKLAQQFKLADACKFLCIVIDHNISDTDSVVDNNRLTEIKSFLKQVRDYLDEQGAATKEWVHFLINKHDLWKNAADTEKRAFETFYKEEIDKWRQGRRAKNVSFHIHSNESGNNIAEFMTLLTSTASK